MNSRLNFTDYITERTKNFVGREWVFAEIRSWLAQLEAPRYLIITGEPGIGKTAIAAQLTRHSELKPAAFHFCIGRRSETLDPFTFAQSLAQQLADIAGFAQYLIADPRIHISGQANIGNSGAHSQAIGVLIQTLVIQAPQGATAFNRVIADPLRQLYAAGFSQPLLILVDALDEAVQYPGEETIVSLLANAQGLPTLVRFVLTCRPDSAALAPFEQAQTPHLLLATEREENQRDLRAYMHIQMKASSALQQRLAEAQMLPETLIDRVATASEGNFLYVTWLLRALEEGIQRFNALTVLPRGLDGIYRDFLRTRFSKDAAIWEHKYRQLFGVLAAAQATLTVDQLRQFTKLRKQEIFDRLRHIQQFLDPSLAAQSYYQLYHQSITDFLGDERRAGEFWVDLAEVHRQIVESYKDQFARWEDLDWQQVDDYGLLYLAKHLYALRSDRTYCEELYQLICQPLMQAKEVRFDSHRFFADDITLAVEVASLEDPPNMVQIVRGSLLYATLGEQASLVPPEILGVLAQLGQGNKALGFAALLQDAGKRCRAYLLIGHSLLMSRERDKAEEFLGLTLASAQGIKDEKRQAEVLRETAEMFVQAGQVEQALTATRQALAVAQEIKDESSRALELCEIAEVLVELGQAEQALTATRQALAIAQEIEDESTHQRGNKMGAHKLRWQNSHLDRIAEVFARLGQVDQALEITQTIQNEHVQARPLCEIAKVLAQAGQGERALTIAQQALTIAQQPSTVVRGIRIETGPSPWLLGLLAEMFVQLGKVEQALTLARQVMTNVRHVGVFEAVGHEKSMLHRVVEAFTQAGQQEQALTLVQQALTTAQMSEGEWSQAEALGGIAEVLAQAGQGEQALAVVQQALTVAQRIKDEWRQLSVLSQIASVFAQLGKVEQALTVAQRIPDEEHQVKALSGIAKLLAQTGQLTQARAVAQQVLRISQEIRNERPYLIALREVAWVFAQLDKVEEALTVIQQALAVAQTIQDARIRARDLSEIAPVFAQLGKVEEALTVAQRIEDKGGQAGALSGIAETLAQAGQQEQALTLVQQALTIAQMSEGEWSQAEVLRRIAEVFAQLGQVEQALTSAQQALTAAVAIQYDWDQALALRGIAEVFLQLGQIEQALQAAWGAYSAADDAWHGGWGLAEIARIYTRLDQVEQALATVQRIEEDNYRAEALYLVAKEVARAGKGEQALILAQQALSVAQAIEHEGNQAGALCRIAKIFAQLGQGEQALILAQQALSIAQAIRDEKSQMETLRLVVETLAQIGQHNQAVLMLPDLFARAQRIGRASIFENLGHTALLLASLDRGRLLWQIFEAVQQVDSWWGLV